MKRSFTLCAAAVWVVAAASAQTSGSTNSTTTTTVTSVTGTITQVNYGPDGEVQGFLIGTNVLLSFPGNICAGVSSLGAAGNSVTYSGTASAATSGFESVQVSSFTNNTTKATYTAPTSSSTSTAYGPTSGTIKQLNYSPDGTIDGFLFSSASTSIFVAIGHSGSTTLTSLLTDGASISVTGTTTPNMSACSSTGALEVVNATSLTVSGQTVVITSGGNGPGGGFGPGGPGGPGNGGPH